MKMKFEQAVLITTALIFLVLGACEEYKSVAAGSSIDNGGGKTDSVLIVPGGEGRTTDDLVFDKDFRVFSMDTGINPDEVTTQETFGRWDDGKYHIQGLSYLGTSSLSATGFVDGYFVYWNKPLTGDYKITARVRMTAVQGFSTSKGIQFGVFAPMNASAANGEQIFSGATRAAGMMFRSSTGSSNPLGEIRFYYATDSGGINFTAGTSSHPGGHIIHNTSYKTEYIFEVSRTKERYTLVVRNSKTGDLVPQGAGQSYNNPQYVNENASGTSALHPSVKYGAPVFAGFALMGCSAELSQINIWDNADGTGEPVFSTPDTTPAYVPVEVLTVDLSPAGSEEKKNIFTFTAAEIQDSGITLTPSFTPTWADNNRVEWLMESCEPSGAITISGTGTPFTLPGINRTTYQTGKITIDDSLIPSGGQASAKFIAIARDLTLDNFTGFPPVDYPNKQTLAEYRFEIVVTK
jgi:hypothetical protein